MTTRFRMGERAVVHEVDADGLPAGSSTICTNASAPPVCTQCLNRNVEPSRARMAYPVCFKCMPPEPGSLEHYLWRG